MAKCANSILCMQILVFLFKFKSLYPRSKVSNSINANIDSKINWHRTGYMALSEIIMTMFIDTYLRHQSSMGQLLKPYYE